MYAESLEAVRNKYSTQTFVALKGSNESPLGSQSTGRRLDLN